MRTGRKSVKGTETKVAWRKSAPSPGPPAVDPSPCASRVPLGQFLTVSGPAARRFHPEIRMSRAWNTLIS